jgi:predicted NAD/FAD-dependent oxidoreductase
MLNDNSTVNCLQSAAQLISTNFLSVSSLENVQVWNYPNPTIFLDRYNISSFFWT